jgi:hypothetical protein
MILDGNGVRDEIEELKPRIAALAAQEIAGGLAVVLVGHNPLPRSCAAKSKLITTSAFTAKL